MSRGKITDLVGKVFGRLTVIKRTEERLHGSIVWICKCSCSEQSTVKVNTISLNSKYRQSCGCYQKEQSLLANTKHGACVTANKEGSDQLDYVIWCKIIQRCYNKKVKNYKNYGGRGITIYKKWRKNFVKFSKYIRTLKNCPDENILISRSYGQRIPRTLDRIDSDGSYEPGNLKWSTKKEQANNRRNNVKVVYKGNTLTLKQAVEKYTSVAYGTVHQRIHTYGWSIEKALETGNRRKKLLRFKRG